MNNTIKGLLGLCLLLIFILLIEWLVLGTSNEEIGVTDHGDKKELALIGLPKLELENQTEETFSSMVESPLFIQGRTPIADDIDDKIDEVVGKVDDVTLLGIYSIKDKTYALFNKKGKDRKYLKKIQGEDIAGWQIVEIRSDRVLIEQNGKKQTLTLRKPKPKVTKKVRINSPRKKIKHKS